MSQNLAVRLFAAALCATSATAQCNTSWATAAPVMSTNVDATDLTFWDPDGPGPLAERPALSWYDWTNGGVIVWDDQSGWQPLGPAFDQAVRTLFVSSTGELYAGGNFTAVGGVAANGIARWDGAAWVPLGAGVANPSWPGTVRTISELPDGRLLIGGAFLSAGGVTAYSVALWDGAAWSTVGPGFGPNGDVRGSCVLEDGSLVIAGSFSMVNGVAAERVARWDGQQWTPFGLGLPSYCIAVGTSPHDDRIFAATTQTVLTWDGASWTQLPFPNSYVKTMAPLPDGSVLIGGLAGDVKRWDGAQWLDQNLPPLGTTERILFREDGAAWVAGRYYLQSGVDQPSIQLLEAGCAATVAATPGCGAALRAETAPWVGGVLRTRASGMPASSLAVVVRGLSPASVPLTTILPQGAPGCALLAQPDSADLVVPAAGEAAAALAIPDAPALVGLDVHEQWLVLELAPSLAITALTATDALVATVGAF